MKKQVLVICLALILIVSAAALVNSAASVIINPSNPSDNDNLVCSIAGSNGDGDFDFYWYKNGQEFRVDYGIASTISSIDTNPGDSWTCAVYTPFANKVGEASVNIPNAVSGNVRINPSQPADSDNLVATVLGNSDSQIYQWYQNGNLVKTETAVSSTISADSTEPGDSWRCIVSGQGEATVQIDTDSDGSVTISPSNPDTNSELSGEVTVKGSTFEFNWFKNGHHFKSEISSGSSISPIDTTKGDSWRVEVYTPLYRTYIGEASIVIENAVPAITSINVPSNAKLGEVYTISFTATDADNDALDYFIVKDNTLIANANTVQWTAEEGSHEFTFWATDDTDWTVESAIVDVAGNARQSVSLYNLEFSPILIDGQYLKIKNTDHSLDNLNLKVTSVDMNEIESFSINMPRNSVKLIPLSFDFKENSSYLLRIDVTSQDFDGKQYIIVDN